ncbi:hypothetical protein E2C01_007090 [Portunus trituberculatus]|uniref:Uncharacterized protein n=1 Tax=Portunus trituberculatus TaxID=210409 RepID=A0A5B7D1G3_PORTR|nr:hypothetical protein [Portunus trituberculatus]
MSGGLVKSNWRRASPRFSRLVRNCEGDTGGGGGGNTQSLTKQDVCEGCGDVLGSVETQVDGRVRNTSPIPHFFIQESFQHPPQLLHQESEGIGGKTLKRTKLTITVALESSHGEGTK